MSCCSSGNCKGCQAVNVVSFLLFTVFELLALAGMWSIHTRMGITSGTVEASLALLAAIIGLMIWSKSCGKMCPCSKMTGCPKGTMCSKCGKSPCSCK